MTRATTLAANPSFKRTLLITGILLVLWHIATAGYLAYLDWLWKIANDRTPDVTSMIAMLADWIFNGVVVLCVTLWIVYTALKTEYKSRAIRIVACLSVCLIVASTIGVSYTSMVLNVLAGERPEHAATHAFICIFMLGTALSLSIFIVIFSGMKRLPRSENLPSS